jgi:hypothetical protein
VLSLEKEKGILNGDDEGFGEQQEASGSNLCNKHLCMVQKDEEVSERP